jgi:hypothetical protein
MVERGIGQNQLIEGRLSIKRKRHLVKADQIEGNGMVQELRKGADRDRNCPVERRVRGQSGKGGCYEKESPDGHS